MFKYYFIDQRAAYIWHEMNLWMRLPKHPHIVPFEAIVVDEIEWRCVGFTTAYIPGGNLKENQTRIFKLKWLHQLTAVIDELNLNIGIAHQDVAPRNLLIDDKTDSLMIFDFDFSARIGMVGHSEARNDVKGVIFTMYEIITHDDTLRAVRHEEQTVLDIEGKEWTLHPDVQLDHPVSEFQRVLAQWSERRRQGERITSYRDAPNFIDWPDQPEPPRSESLPGSLTEMVPQWQKKRTEMLQEGETVLNWQRPPHAKLKAGDRILETGELVQET